METTPSVFLEVNLSSPAFGYWVGDIGHVEKLSK